MRILTCALAIGISFCAVGSEGILAGQLQESPNGTFRISNEQHPDDLHSNRSLVLTGEESVLKELKSKVGKFVELHGSYGVSDTATRFKIESAFVLADSFYIDGECVRYKHPDGSMEHVNYAIVTKCGDYYPLDLRDFKEDVPLKQVRAFGEFKSDGHKGFLLSFRVAKLELIEVKEAKK